jgi:arsenate reductase
VEGPDESRRAFQRAFRELEARIEAFTSLPVESLDPVALEKQLDEIGRLKPEK